jgi:hypothetical protein
MTQFVISLYYEHRFQYVERRYSGFVALSFVVAADAGLDHLRNQRVKSPKEFDPGWRSAGNPNASDSASQQIDKIRLDSWKPSIPTL